jgi:hypothetical protein
MKWDEFIKKLADAKKQKKTKGLSVPAITTLIFSGAFDDMMEPLGSGRYTKMTDNKIMTRSDKEAHEIVEVCDRVSIYRIMYEDVKKALKSKASLPTKKKGDLVSLSDIKNDAQLQIWRHQVNPTISFSFVDSCLENMKTIGYERVDRGSIEAVKKHTNDKKEVTGETIVVGNWSKLPDDNNHPVVRDLLHGRRNIGAVGVITNVKKQSYKNYKGESQEMIKIELFNGYGYIKDLIVWPDRKTGKINEYLKENLKKDRLGILEMSVSINKKNGSRSFSIQNWHTFMTLE